MIENKKIDKENTRNSHQKCSIKTLHLEMFCEKVVFKSFAKLPRKYLCQNLIFNKIAGLICKFNQKETPAKVFSCKSCETFKSTFFTEHLRATASDIQRVTAIDYRCKQLVLDQLTGF